MLLDVEYKSKDSSGNEYILKASEGIIDQNDSNIIYLTTINAVIKLRDYNSIDISSNFGKYSIYNFDTIFSKNVILKYNESSLKADVIEVDIKTKDIKISMYEENKKINIESTN